MAGLVSKYLVEDLLISEVLELSVLVLSVVDELEKLVLGFGFVSVVALFVGSKDPEPSKASLNSSEASICVVGINSPNSKSLLSVSF
jgi:hypothetical protein